MSRAASEVVLPESAPIAGVPEPANRTWAPGAPSPELKRYVRSLSVLGVTVADIRRRVQERIGVRSYGLRDLYRDFREDLLPKMKRGSRDGKYRVRLIEKPQGWRPLKKGSPFSYGDVIAILQSDLDSRDLARLYGVRDVLITRIRTGDSWYAMQLVPRVVALRDRVSKQEMAYRAHVTASLAVKLVSQMAQLVDYAYELVRREEIADPMAFDAPKMSRYLFEKKFYRKNDEGVVEERVCRTPWEIKTAKAAGWTKTRPE